jgi:hypothetical protein
LTDENLQPQLNDEACRIIYISAGKYIATEDGRKATEITEWNTKQRDRQTARLLMASDIRAIENNSNSPHQVVHHLR